MLKTVALLSILRATFCQKPGSLKTENHPELSFQTCTQSGCTTETKHVVVDSNWRWTHKNGQPENCYEGDHWDQDTCSDPQQCIKNCEIEGADEEYADTYGIKASGASLKLQFVTQGPASKNVGSRSYLLDDEDTYTIFKLKNREFTFDADTSQLPCGLNGALYFVQMDADGGKSKYPTNTAGAKYGTGYCDAQCPHDLKFINGEANVLDWNPSPTDPNAGTGKYGSCCVEMDIWEANSISTAYTAHSCAVEEQTRCEGVGCGDNPDHRFDGYCDKNGCDLQTYRLGNTTFYGKGAGFALDSSKPMTVVTQFITADGTDEGPLSEIRRFYVQGGKKIATPTLHVGGEAHSSLSHDYCAAEVAFFADNTTFLKRGGFGSMDDAFEKGVVLVMSIWDDHDVNMLWLDSTYPVNGTKPGDARGSCASTSGVPKDVESASPDASVTYANIRFGEIGTTVPTLPPPSPGPSPSPPSPSPTPSGCPGGSLAACMAACPSTPIAAYQACVAECAKRCTPPEPQLAAGATPACSAAWGLCGGTAPCCPLGFACSARGGHGLSQCTPTSALFQAFARMQPSDAAVDAFLTNGTTHFPASGLPVRGATLARVEFDAPSK